MSYPEINVQIATFSNLHSIVEMFREHVPATLLLDARTWNVIVIFSPTERSSKKHSFPCAGMSTLIHLAKAAQQRTVKSTRNRILFQLQRAQRQS